MWERTGDEGAICEAATDSHYSVVPTAIRVSEAPRARLSREAASLDRWSNVMVLRIQCAECGKRYKGDESLLGRKTICVNFSGTPDRYSYVEDGGAVGARSEKELGEAMQRIFQGDFEQEWAAERRRFLDHHAGLSAEGRAADALVDQVLSIGAKKQ